MVRLLQGLYSSNSTIIRSIIVSRFIETDGIKIDYLSLPQVVTVLDSTEHQKRRA